MKKLLSVSRDFKTTKGESQGYLTGVLYLAPADIVKGINVCPFATEGCKKACLYTAGKGAIYTVKAARIKKTEYFRDNRQEFMLNLVENIKSLIWKAYRNELIPVVRLNGTSDISWENIKFTYNGEIVTILSLFPNLQFYDYTKNPYRTSAKNFPKNYYLTFSRSETNEKDVIRLAKTGQNVSVVFKSMPDTYLGKKVVNGDKNDLRFLDEKNVIVGLLPKGKARKDQTGFVV